MPTKIETAAKAALTSAAARALPALALLACCLASANASAGLLDKLLAPVSGPAPAGFSEGKKVYNEDTFKPEELKACIIKARELDQAVSQQTPEEVAALEKERQALSAEAKELAAAAEASKDNPLPEDQAAKLNERIKVYGERQKAFNEKINAVNSKAVDKSKSLVAQRNDFIDNCSGRRIYRSDLEAIRPSLPFDISSIAPPPAPAAAKK
jgi:hypothetical protein